MSVYLSDNLQLIPFARAERIRPSAAPTFYVYGFVTVTGDSSGGAATVDLVLPGGYIMRTEAISVTSSDAAADTGNIHVRAPIDWIEDALPVNNTFYEATMPMVAFNATKSAADTTAMGAYVSQLRRIPLGRINGQSTLAQIRVQFENNVNTQNYYLEVFGVAWDVPALGIADFLDFFTRS